MHGMALQSPVLQTVAGPPPGRRVKSGGMPGGGCNKNKNLLDDPAILDQTRQYLLDAQRLLGQRPTPREYFDQIIAKYPDRLNQGPVWYSALGLLN
jgi:hypothetical protein